MIERMERSVRMVDGSWVESFVRIAVVFIFSLYSIFFSLSTSLGLILFLLSVKEIRVLKT